jgi:phosphate transport system substrate-binding protein
VTRILNGSVTKWSEIYPGSKKGEITVVFDNKKSSAVHFVEDSILGGKPISNPNVAAVETSEEVINFVEKTPGAIGIIGSNWLDDKRGDSSVARNRNIRTMSVTRLDKATPTNSRKPDQYYIYSREYPLIRTIYALVTDPRRGLPWGFAHFLESPRGQMIIFQTGYMLPYRGDIRLKSVKVNN